MSNASIISKLKDNLVYMLFSISLVLIFNFFQSLGLILKRRGSDFGLLLAKLKIEHQNLIKLSQTAYLFREETENLWASVHEQALGRCKVWRSCS